MHKKTLTIVLPVYNEARVLKNNVLLLKDFLQTNLTNYDWQIIIADNVSTDETFKIAQQLKKDNSSIKIMRLKTKGRGGAIKTAWLQAKTDILSYMDIDLSTSLKHFPNLIKSLESDYDLACGNRLLSKSQVINRTIKREILSRGYNYLVQFFLQVKFSDPQCGFKAINNKTAIKLLPKTKNINWFFDTELLVLAEKYGFKIYQEPVVWEDDPSSSVNTLSTIFEDIKGILRLWVNKPWKEIN